MENLKVDEVLKCTTGQFLNKYKLLPNFDRSIMEKRHKHKKYERRFQQDTQWRNEDYPVVFSEVPRRNSLDTDEIERETLNQIVPDNHKKFGNLKLRGSSVTSSSSVISYSSGAESFTDLSPIPSSVDEPVAMFPHCSKKYSILNTCSIPESTEEPLEDNQDKLSESETGNKTFMTNMEFFKIVDPLHNKISESSIRLQSFLGNYTQYGLEDSTMFKNLKSNLLPYIADFTKVLETIPRVLSSTTPNHRNFVEIGATAKYQICQPSFEKAVSKYSIKDASVALAECDLFLTKIEKLESTIGRVSSSSGKKLKPLDPAKLNALYHVIADKTKMPNIQRTEECSNSSPNFLTVKEQKMVREALSQYFNQLRQRQKRKRSNPDYVCNIINSLDESSVN